MKHSSTFFLKAIIFLMGLVVLGLCLFVLPTGIRTSMGWDGYRPLLLGMYVPAVPFFIALYHGFKLLIYIDHNQAFSSLSVKSLQVIKHCGIIISALYALGLPYIFKMAQLDDAPGVMLLGLIFTFAPAILAVFAAVLEKIFQNAIQIKSENELTV
jgi:hypothetical protein